MPKYRENLPVLGEKFFVTDGGLETELIFKHGIDLPEFAAFPLLEKPDTRKIIEDYFRGYADIALQNGAGLVLEACTYKASWNWASRIGYDRESLRRANLDAIDFLVKIRDELETENSPMVISAQCGPAEDGYDPDNHVSIDEAEAYHSEQIGWFAETEADMVSLFTVTSSDEAIGFVRAAKKAAMPCVVSFTVETDGRLPNGEALADAISRTDMETDNGPVYYMINCAHPSHFEDTVEGESAAWKDRILALRPNASVKSHDELAESTELDPGNPPELGQQVAELRAHLPHLHILGGCCGTCDAHVAAMARQWS